MVPSFSFTTLVCAYDFIDLYVNTRCWMSEKDVMDYKIATNEMVDHGATQYSPSAYGIESVSIFKRTIQFWKTTISIPYPMTDPTTSRSCVTGNDQYLVMFLSDNPWISGASMQ
eukprot:488946_1